MDSKAQRVLLVDDIPENIQVAGSFLQSANYDLSFAPSGKAAFELLAAEDFDLILLDISMPEMDGFEVCTQLKANPDWKHIPVIFLTARADEASILQAFKVGCADYVTKPYKGPELLARVQTQLSLRQKEKALEDNNNALKLFLSVMAHDLKGPYTGLLGWAEILHKDHAQMSPEFLAQAAEHILISAKLSFDLLTNLLTWARSQTGHLELHSESFQLVEVVQEIMALYRVDPLSPGRQIHCDVPDDLWVYADKAMIATVLRNLIDNGLKFSNEEGQVRVSAISKGDQVQVSVKDTGIGMKPALVQNLFKLGQKVVSKPAGGTKGTGLGLLICAEFIARHDRQIWATSELGQGSQFHFVIPGQQRETTEAQL